MDIIIALGKIAGIAGIGLGVLLFLFKDIIAKNIFPKMTREQGYKTIRLLILLIWSIAITGLGIWTFFEYLKTTIKIPVTSLPNQKSDYDKNKTNSKESNLGPTEPMTSTKKTTAPNRTRLPAKKYFPEDIGFEFDEIQINGKICHPEPNGAFLANPIYKGDKIIFKNHKTGQKHEVEADF